MATLVDIILRLDEMGLTDILLPFMLIFALMFAILNNVGLFGAKKNINQFLALTISLMVVVPHVTGSYPAGKDIVLIINSAIPNVTGVVIGAIMFLILIGLFGLKPRMKGSPIGAFLILGSAIVILLIFGNSAGWFNLGLPNWLSFLNDPDTQALIVVLLMFWIIIAMVTAKDPDEGKDGFTRFANFMGSGFAGLYDEDGTPQEPVGPITPY